MTGSRASACSSTLLVFLLGTATIAAQPPAPAQVPRARVLVELRTPDPYQPEARLGSATAVAAQRRAIEAAADRLLTRLAGAGHRVVRRYQTVPFLALEVTPGGRTALQRAAEVVRVLDDEIVRPVLAQSVPLVQGDQAWAAGYDGSGTTIAVLDTGVDAQHPFLGGRVVAEACFSSTVPGVSQTTCPNGGEVQVGPGAAAPCSLADCLHGTHVAGIAAGSGSSAGVPYSGVARNARVMAIQVFSVVTSATSCGGAAPCAGAFSSDIIAGLEYVYSAPAALNVAAVNMSLGSTTYASFCDDQPYKPAIDNLRAIGIASVVASGNSFAGNAISSPACISSAISVGATTKTDEVAFFSNVAPFISLFAPGEAIRSSVPGAGFSELSGTSMAAPHVAGAWAIVRQAAPGRSVSAVLSALRSTGRPITDSRWWSVGSTAPRINILEALATLVPITNPVPVISSFSPARLRAGISPVTLTVNGASFNAFSVVLWNGSPRPTTVVSTTQLTALISPSDLTAAASAQVAVRTPSPGGGTTASLTVPIDPPPSLVPNRLAVAPGAQVTVTLANGYGGSGDWLSFAPATAANSSYQTFTYVGAGVTTRTWTVTAPATLGTYEFRLFLDNSYTRVATSAPVVVDVGQNPQPSIASLSPASVAATSPAFTLTVNGADFVTGSVVLWNGTPRPTTFVSATQVRAAIDAADVAVVGQSSVAVSSPAPGGGVSNALPFSATPPAVLTVSATTVAPGSSVTVTLTNAPGGAYDWLALAPTSAANSSYVTFTYVGAGVTSRTWTVSMPATAGTYEFRLFLNNGYTRAGTSPPVTVSAAVNPAPAATSLSPARASAGSAGFTLTVNGTNFVAASEVRWNGAPRATTFVSATQLRASIPAADIAVPSTAQVTVFSPAPGGGTSAPLAFTIAPPPTLTVSATTVARGTPVTVTLTDGLGGLYDWLSFAPVTAANSSFVTFVYVGGGITSRTWTVTAPSTPGTYEFRLFLNNGYTRAATSVPVIVQ
ncbi:MAG TPA: S8 family serine peptidase [Vicinamibacterales bacterium]|nr:S8 family serine peptidase [Vicinamibacterales bacterium]